MRYYACWSLHRETDIELVGNPLPPFPEIASSVTPRIPLEKRRRLVKSQAHRLLLGMLPQVLNSPMSTITMTMSS